MPSLDEFPDELIIAIAEQCSEEEALASWAQTSSRYNAIVGPIFCAVAVRQNRLPVLHHAATYGLDRLARRALEAGADPNQYWYPKYPKYIVDCVARRRYDPSFHAATTDELEAMLEPRAIRLDFRQNWCRPRQWQLEKASEDASPSVGCLEGRLGATGNDSDQDYKKRVFALRCEWELSNLSSPSLAGEPPVTSSRSESWLLHSHPTPESDIEFGTAQHQFNNWLPPHGRNVGWTPLHLAAYYGHSAIVQLLLDHHAKAYLRSRGLCRCERIMLTSFHRYPTIEDWDAVHLTVCASRLAALRIILLNKREVPRTIEAFALAGAFGGNDTMRNLRRYVICEAKTSRAPNPMPRGRNKLVTDAWIEHLTDKQAFMFQFGPFVCAILNQQWDVVDFLLQEHVPPGRTHELFEYLFMFARRDLLFEWGHFFDRGYYQNDEFPGVVKRLFPYMQDYDSQRGLLERAMQLTFMLYGNHEDAVFGREALQLIIQESWGPMQLDDLLSQGTRSAGLQDALYDGDWIRFRAFVNEHANLKRIVSYSKFRLATQSAQPAHDDPLRHIYSEMCMPREISQEDNVFARPFVESGPRSSLCNIVRTFLVWGYPLDR
ncbi:hypothetical protein PG988_011749 [Apiospora saccharicola]